MTVVNVDTNSESAFKPRSFEPAPKGIYIFSLSGPNGSFPLTIAPSESSGRDMVAVELHLEANADGSESPYKGRIVRDYCVLKDKNGQTDKMGTEKLAHLAQCFGAMTQDAIRTAGGVDLDFFAPDQRGKVEINVKVEKYEGEDRPKNNVVRYLWE